MENSEHSGIQREVAIRKSLCSFSWRMRPEVGFGAILVAPSNPSDQYSGTHFP